MTKATRGKGVFASALVLLAGVFPKHRTGLNPVTKSTTRIGSPSKSMATFPMGRRYFH